MPLSSRSQTTGSAADPAQASFQWMGPTTADEYYGSGLSSQKPAAPAPAPAAPIAASTGISSRSGEGQTVISSQQPQPAPAPTPKPAAPVVQKTPITTPGAAKKFSTAEEENAYVQTLTTAEARRYFGDAWGKMSYKEAKARGAVGTYVKSILPFQYERDATKEYYRQLATVPPEVQGLTTGEGWFTKTAKAALQNTVELGIDATELLGLAFAPDQAYPILKGFTIDARQKLGLPQETIDSEKSRLGKTDEFAQMGSDAKNMVVSMYDGFKTSITGMAAWAAAMAKGDHVAADEMSSQMAFDLRQGLSSFGGLGDKVRQTWGISADKSGVYVKGQKIRDLTKPEAEVQGGMQAVGGLINSLALWSKISPWIEKGVIATNPAVFTTMAEAHPILFRGLVTNAVEETTQAVVSNIAGVPYNFGDTVFGLSTQFLMTAATGVKGGVVDPELKDIDIDEAMKQADTAVQDFVIENKRPPSTLELQEMLGEQMVPGTRKTWNEVHRNLAQRYGSDFGENRLIYKDTVENFGDPFRSEIAPDLMRLVDERAASLGTDASDLIDTVRAAGDNMDDIDAALKQKYGEKYDTAVTQAMDAAMNGEGSLDMVDFKDPIRRAAFGDVVPLTEGEASFAKDMVKAGADPKIAARAHEIIADGEVRTVDYFGEKAEAVDRAFTIPKMTLDDLRTDTPTKIGDIEIDPKSVSMAFDDAANGRILDSTGNPIEGAIQNPIQIFYDLNTGKYSLQNGYHRLLETVARGDTSIKGEIVFGRHSGDSFYVSPDNVKLMTVKEVRAAIKTPETPRRVEPRIDTEERAPETPTEVTPEDRTIIQQTTPSDRAFLRENVNEDGVLTVRTKADERTAARLIERGIAEKSGETVQLTRTGERALQLTKSDLPPEVAPARAPSERQLYGQRLYRGEYDGRPVTSNSYILDFDEVKDNPELGKLKNSSLTEEQVARVLAPAETADVQLTPFAYRDLGVDRAAAESMFLRSQNGDVSRVDLDYFNHFIKKYGDDITFYGKQDAIATSPVAVRSADGRMLGMIMPIRQDTGVEPRPLPLQQVPVSGLSSRIRAAESALRENSSLNGKSTAEVASVLRSTKRIMGEGTEKYARQVESLASRQGELAKQKASRNAGNAPTSNEGGGGKGKPPKKGSTAPGGKEEPSGLSSRKKPSKQPKSTKETQPARTSRLRDRLEQPAPTKPLEPKQAAMVKFLQDEFTAPIRTGKTKPGSLGTFYPDKNVIRTRNALDIDTAAHEVGHYLDNEYGLTDTIRTGKRYMEPYRSELMKLGEPTSRPSYTATQKIKEGIAEYVRLSMTDPAAARAAAPKFHAHFIGNMPDAAMRLFDQVAQAHAKMMAESPEYRVKSHISTEQPKAPIGERARKAVDSVFSAIDDDLLMIRKFVREGERITGTEVKFKDDPYVLARLVRGLDGKVLQFLTPGLKPFDGKGQFLEEQRSLGSILRDVGTRRSDFEAYLVAKRAQDLHKQEIKTGITGSDADAVVKLMEERHNDFPALQKEIVGWNRSLLQYANDRGFLSAEQVKNMTENGDNYVPFFRVIDELTVKGNARKKFADVANPFKKIKGSTRQIISPIESMTKNAYVIMSAVDRNRVGQAMVRLAASHPDLGRYIEEIPAGAKPITLNVDDVLKKLGIEEPSDTGQETVTLFVHGSKPNVAGENIMMVVNDGKPSYYSVDPMLYKAITAMSEENASMVIRMLSAPASLLRAGATLTPEFIGRNPLRDQITAGMYSRANYVPYMDLVRGITDVIAKSDDYQRAAIGGAMQSAFVSMDRSRLKNHMDRVFATKGENAVHYFLHPIDALRALSEFGELGTRVGEAQKVFAKEMRTSADIEEALTKSAFAARNITLDFARRGWAGKTMNAITAFWNAQIQDISKFSRELSGREKGGNPAAVAAKAALLITLPSLAFYEVSKHDERYQELPRWQKDYFWILALPGMPVIRIPKPFLPGLIFGSLPTRMLEAQEKNDIRPLQDFFVSLRENVTPGLIPTALLPIIEATTNHSFFFDRDIVPYDQQRLLPPDQYGIYTSEVYKEIGQQLNLSPLKIESLVYGYTAGLGRYASGMLDFLGAKTGVLPEKPVPPEDPTQIPFIKAFTISDLSTTGESLNDFYNLYTQAEKAQNSFDAALEKGDENRAREIRNNNLPDLIYVTPQGEPQMLYDALGAAAMGLSQLRDAREAVLTSTKLTPEEKTEKIIKINETMRMLARRTLDVTRLRPGSIDELRSTIGK